MMNGVTGDRCALCTPGEAPCPRCSAHERLPRRRLLQAFLTFVAGAPHPGQRPLIRKSPRICLAGTFAVLVTWSGLGSACVLTLSEAASPAYWVALLPLTVLSVVSTSGAFRAMHTFVLHHASHEDFGRRSRLAGDVAGIIGMTQSYADYRRDHRVHHAALTSALDPDQQALAALGFLPGLPRAAYPALLRHTLIHPGPHLRTSAARLRANVSPRTRPLRSAVFLITHGLPLLAAVTGAHLSGQPGPLIAWITAWLIPLTVGHHISAVLYALGLHAWYRRSPAAGWAGFAERTGARFFADPCPARLPGGRPAALAWTRWWLRLILWHLCVARLLVIGPTDNGCHDAHHADPAGRRFDWCNAAYARPALLAQLPHTKVHFWHTWSLSGAIRRNFDQLADQDGIA